MVRHHVAQGASHIEVTAALFHAHRFSYRDLHVVNVVLVPNRFKDAIAEAENQNVLHGLFAQIMVNAENLIFGEHSGEMLV